MELNYLRLLLDADLGGDLAAVIASAITEPQHTVMGTMLPVARAVVVPPPMCLAAYDQGFSWPSRYHRRCTCQ